jgi:hypothetical protein
VRTILGKEGFSMKRFVCIPLIIIIGTIGSFSTSSADMQAGRIGAKIGFVSPEGTIGSAFGIGGSVELGRISPSFRTEGNIELWHKSRSIYNWSYTDFCIDTTSKYDITLSQNQMVPFVGGGLGIHILRWGYGESNPVVQSNISTDLAIHIVGGMEYKFSDGKTGFVEAKLSAGGWDYTGLFVGMKF